MKCIRTNIEIIHMSSKICFIFYQYRIESIKDNKDVSLIDD